MSQIEHKDVVFGGGWVGVKQENRGRRPRFPYKEEKRNHLCPNFSIRRLTLLDAYHTISLLVPDNTPEFAYIQSYSPERSGIRLP